MKWRSPLETHMVWAKFGLALCVAALMVAVELSSWLNYAYPFWYDLLDIQQHINTYAPQNAYIPNFETLTPAAHQQAFAETVRAVHNQGQGLAEIQFIDSNGQSHPLYWHDEIVHLQDVAHLLDWLRYAGLVAMMLCWAFLQYARYRGLAFRWVSVALGPVAIVVLLALCFAVWGFEPVFNQLHIWAFPPEHPWFFYYQESLMSTLMKAPDLFLYVGLMISAMTLVLVTISLALVNRLFKLRHEG